MSPSLSVVADNDLKTQKAETVAERVRRLQAEAKQLAKDHVHALTAAIMDAEQIAAEIAEGGEGLSGRHPRPGPPVRGRQRSPRPDAGSARRPHLGGATRHGLAGVLIEGRRRRPSRPRGAPAPIALAAIRPCRRIGPVAGNHGKHGITRKVRPRCGAPMSVPFWESRVPTETHERASASGRPQASSYRSPQYRAARRPPHGPSVSFRVFRGQIGPARDPIIFDFRAHLRHLGTNWQLSGLSQVNQPPRPTRTHGGGPHGTLFRRGQLSAPGA